MAINRTRIWVRYALMTGAPDGTVRDWAWEVREVEFRDNMVYLYWNRGYTVVPFSLLVTPVEVFQTGPMEDQPKFSTSLGGIRREA